MGDVSLLEGVLLEEYKRSLRVTATFWTRSARYLAGYVRESRHDGHACTHGDEFDNPGRGGSKTGPEARLTLCPSLNLPLLVGITSV